MSGGWIKLHRKIIDDPIFQNEKLLKVWLYCLLKASHKEHESLVGMQLVKVKPGEFVFGRKKAAADLSMKESTVWDRMKLLEKLGNINIKSNNKFSIVNVVNWGKYQDKDNEVQQQNQQQTDNSPTTNQQQTDTNKNVKNEKNEKKDNQPSSLDSDFEKLWKLYPKKTMKKDALAAYKKAIKKGATNKDIQTGIVAYKKHLAANSDWLKPQDGGRWFKKERWGDDFGSANSSGSPQNSSSSIEYLDDRGVIDE